MEAKYGKTVVDLAAVEEHKNTRFAANIKNKMKNVVTKGEVERVCMAREELLHLTYNLRPNSIDP